MDTLQGPALAEALARVVGVPAERVQVDGRIAVYEIDRDRYLTLQCMLDGSYALKLWTDPRPAPDACGYGPTPEAARDDALSRLRAGYEAVRDVLDPWREGPPSEDWWYEVEASHPLRPYVVAWRDGKGSTLGGWAPGWAFAVGADGVERPARYRALHLSAPPERGTACTP